MKGMRVCDFLFVDDLHAYHTINLYFRTTCRYASLFLHPVTNEIAPNYSSIVLRPMDLSTLKKNVENGLVCY